MRKPWEGQSEHIRVCHGNEQAQSERLVTTKVYFLDVSCPGMRLKFLLTGIQEEGADTILNVTTYCQREKG